MTIRIITFRGYISCIYAIVIQVLGVFLVQSCVQFLQCLCIIHSGDRCGRFRIVVGFTTTYAISVYHHHNSCSWRVVLDTRIYDKVCQWVSPGSSSNKADRQDMTEILLKVSLNPIIITLTLHSVFSNVILSVSMYQKANKAQTIYKTKAIM